MDEPEATPHIDETIQQESVTQEAKWTTATRQSYHADHPDCFAGPDMSFPIKDGSDAKDAIRLHGHAANPAQVKSNIIRIAYKLGLQGSLPDDWKRKEDKESVFTQELALSQGITLPIEHPGSPPFNPKPRVASFRSCWLEDNAISLNRRQYPSEIGDALLADGQSQLADPNPLPIACYATHADAESDTSRHITGKISQLWREGRKLYAMIDVPDTRIGRDFASMVANGYIKSQSLRAMGVTTRLVKGKSLPQVVAAPGEKVRFLGIDFTTMPGLDRTARIDNVILEDAPADVFFIDSFTVENSLLQEAMMGEKQDTTIVETAPKEDALPQLATGVSQGVDNSPTQSDYSKRTMIIPPVEDPNTTGFSAAHGIRESVQMVHDHCASMLGLPCSGMKETGRAINKSNRTRLVEMHDTSAKHLNLSCRESAANMLLQSDSKQKDNDMEDATESQGQIRSQNVAPPKVEESKPMMPEEMVAALRSAGFSIQAPKTREELLKEEIEQRLTEQQSASEARFEMKLQESLEGQRTALTTQYSKLEEQQTTLLEAITALKVASEPRETPQRRSLVESASRSETLSRRNGTLFEQMLLEQIKPEEVERLAYRYEPLPASMQTEKGIENAIKEFGQLLAYQIDEKWGIQTSPQ